MNHPVGNIRAPAAGVIDGGYGSDARVVHFGKTGQVIKQYKLRGIWPLDISPIELDWGQNDTVEEFTVTLAVQYWEDQSLAGSAGVGVTF